MQAVPLQALAAQIVTVQLGSQTTQLTIRQMASGLYVDVYVNNMLIVGGVLALQANLIVRDAYLGFVGDLAFFDTEGADDPYYTGLGSRWVLMYLTA
ncbi:MAG: phage baseplate plug family protein [Caulobacteraceae bacterium]